MIDTTKPDTLIEPLLTGGSCLLRTRLKPETEPQTALAIATSQVIRP